MGLRPYQEAAVEAIGREWGAGRSRTLLVQATGTGKTVVMAEVARRETEAGGRTLLLAHRGELLEQAADKIGRFAGLACGVEKAEQTAGFLEPVVVGSVQSMCRPSRLERFSPREFSLVMVDEAHHSVSGSYQCVLDHFAGARVLGVTATPDRADKRGLAETFDSIAYEYGIADAVRDGYLVPIVARQMPVEVDMRGVRTQAGDFAASDVGDRLGPMLPAIAQAMVDAGCRGRKSVAFLPLVETSRKFAEACRAVGLRAAEVNGESPDRADILADFDAGRYDVLCNAMLLTEGWDCPSVDCVVPLRATKSRALYCQMVGRGTRLSPETGKENLLLLDFLWMTERHSLCRPASLVAGTAEVADRMAEIMDGGSEFDVLALEAQAERDVVAERERALADELERQRHRKAKTVDPLQYAMSIDAADLAMWEPQFAWEKDEPTQKQLEALERFGIDPDAVWCKGMACQLMDRLVARRAAGLATPKQIRFLEGRGFWRVGRWSFDAAQRMIQRFANNGWKAPDGVDPAKYVPQELMGR